jgi:aarF domain-containing kinase
LFASGGVVASAGASLLAFGDDIKTSYEATERAGRVAAALGICINEYVANFAAHAESN